MPLPPDQAQLQPGQEGLQLLARRNTAVDISSDKSRLLEFVDETTGQVVAYLSASQLLSGGTPIGQRLTVLETVNDPLLVNPAYDNILRIQAGEPTQNPGVGVVLQLEAFPESVDNSQVQASLSMSKHTGFGPDASIFRRLLSLAGDSDFLQTNRAAAGGSSHGFSLIVGTVRADGTKDGGDGFSPARTVGAPAGRYTLFFNTPFSAFPFVIPVSVSAGGIRLANIDNLAPWSGSQVGIQMLDVTGSYIDAPFCFIAIGPTV